MLYRNVYSTCETSYYNLYFVETFIKTDSLNNDNDDDVSGYLCNGIGTILDNRCQYCDQLVDVRQLRVDYVYHVQRQVPHTFSASCETIDHTETPSGRWRGMPRVRAW